MGCSSCREPGHVFVASSQGMCRACGETCEVRYMSDDGAVYLDRLCPTHGKSRALVAESFAWYLEAMQSANQSQPPSRKIVARTGSCPSSCGPCSFHAQKCHLPVFSITNACDLRCPICFTYNRSDQPYFMSPEEFRQHLDYVIEATGGVDLVNITGGEPTRHPELFALLEIAKRPEIGRVTMNTNGLTIAKDPDFAKRLADLGVYVILSLDTLDPQVSKRVHGRDITGDKLRAMENLAKHDVQTTLLMVLIGGVNEPELGAILDLSLQSDFVRSLTVQTMTYTGQGGGTFGPRQHIPVDGVERRIETASSGRIRVQDFIPMPSAHPLCYGVAYLLKDAGGQVHPFTALLGRDAVARHLGDGYLIHPSEALESDLRSSIDRLWAEGGKDHLLRALKGLLTQLYPVGQPLSVHERQRRAERSVKTIYVHSHMDEDTYEVGRAMRCPDQVPVHAERLVGACNYNLFYRKQDPRFWREP